MWSCGLCVTRSARIGLAAGKSVVDSRVSPVCCACRHLVYPLRGVRTSHSMPLQRMSQCALVQRVGHRGRNDSAKWSIRLPIGVYDTTTENTKAPRAVNAASV